MLKNSGFAVLACLVLLHVPLHAQEQKDEIRKNLKFRSTGELNWLEVDNVNGSIQVTGYDGDEVQMLVHRTIWGRSEEKIQQAKDDVVLDIEENGNQIILYVDAPYRRRDGSVNYRGRRYGYEVTMDFELKVPFSTSLALKTINNGTIEVGNVRGDFDVDNVNGSVTMHGLAGSGRIYALNGKVDVEFVENPTSDSYFGSLNGDVRVSLRPGLSADLHFKTFNGSVYTDFDFTSLPAKMTTTKGRKYGKFMYKTNDVFGVRVANGGPALKFDAFNGTIYVNEAN